MSGVSGINQEVSNYGTRGKRRTEFVGSPSGSKKRSRTREDTARAAKALIALGVSKTTRKPSSDEADPTFIELSDGTRCAEVTLEPKSVPSCFFLVFAENDNGDDFEASKGHTFTDKCPYDSSTIECHSEFFRNVDTLISKWVKKTLDDGTVWEYKGDDKTWVEMNWETSSVTQCLHVIQRLPDGTVCEYKGDDKTWVEMNMETSNVTQCLHVIQTLPDGTVKHYNGDEKNSITMDPTTGKVTECFSVNIFIDQGYLDCNKWLCYYGCEDVPVKVSPATGNVTQCFSIHEISRFGDTSSKRQISIGSKQLPLVIDAETGSINNRTFSIQRYTVTSTVGKKNTIEKAEYLGNLDTPVIVDPTNGDVTQFISAFVTENSSQGTREYFGLHSAFKVEKRFDVTTCVSMFRTDVNGNVFKYFGDEYRPIEIDPFSKQVLECGRILHISEGFDATIIGNKHFPLRIDEGKHFPEKCLSIKYIGGKNKPVQINPEIQVAETTDDAWKFLIQNGGTLECIGDANTPVEIDPTNACLKKFKSMTFTQPLPNGSILKYRGSANNPIDVDLTGKIIQYESVFVTKRFTDGAILEYCGDLKTPIEIHSTTGNVTKYKSVSVTKTLPDGVILEYTGDPNNPIVISDMKVTHFKSVLVTTPKGNADNTQGFLANEFAKLLACESQMLIDNQPFHLENYLAGLREKIKNMDFFSESLKIEDPIHQLVVWYNQEFQQRARGKLNALLTSHQPIEENDIKFLCQFSSAQSAVNQDSQGVIDYLTKMRDSHWHVSVGGQPSVQGADPSLLREAKEKVQKGGLPEQEMGGGNFIDPLKSGMGGVASVCDGLLVNRPEDDGYQGISTSGDGNCLINSFSVMLMHHGMHNQNQQKNIEELLGDSPIEGMFDGTYSFQCQHEITKRLKPKLCEFFRTKIEKMRQNRNDQNDEYVAFISNLHENINNKNTISDVNEFIEHELDKPLVQKYLAEIEGNGSWLGMETIKFMSEFFECSDPPVNFPTDSANGKFAFYGLNRDTGGLIREGSANEPYALRNNHGKHWTLFFKTSNFQ